MRSEKHIAALRAMLERVIADQTTLAAIAADVTADQNAYADQYGEFDDWFGDLGREVRSVSGDLEMLRCSLSTTIDRAEDALKWVCEGKPDPAPAAPEPPFRFLAHDIASLFLPRGAA